MRTRILIAAFAFSVLLSACTGDGGDAGSESAQRREEKKRKDPVAGVAKNVGGVREGSDGAFGAAADAMP